MTKHYSVPGAPPCRCAWCRAKQVHPLWVREEIVLGNDHPVRIANRQQAEQERRRLDAEELAEWLAQDVH